MGLADFRRPEKFPHIRHLSSAWYPLPIMYVLMMQVLQRYFTPHSAAMAEYALANAVINRVKGQAKHSDEAHLSPIASLSSKEGEQSRLLCLS